ncbi:MAG: indole-3-glycerol phosphate synthase TrpC [Candidatus Omnitrophica bacterium]|nr:indole-3-glycerol phosphate synthase TrpC [Candidatus Omnitrophota bacterium]
MPDILHRIVADKRPEIEALREGKDFESYLAAAAAGPHPRDFKGALARANRITLIAELKKASPSKGILREDFDPPRIAQGYKKGGASALSVLTEKLHFQGDPAYLAQVRDHVPLPILRKDFIVDRFQIPESRLLGADAILLIASILTDSQISEFIRLAETLHLAALCEVHDEEEMSRVVGCGARLIGINNRDLRTFEVTLQTTFDLAPLAPEDAVLVSESGIRCWADLEILRDAGVSAVLVGETLIRQADVAQAARNLFDPRAPSPSFD